MTPDVYDMHTCSGERADERFTGCCHVCRGHEAREANSAEKWSALWSTPESTDWREHALASVYDRIVELMPPSSSVIDIGGGVGMLASRLKERGHDVEVWEHNTAATTVCRERGLRARYVDLEDAEWPHLMLYEPSAVVATEVLEHLSDWALNWVLRLATDNGKPCFFSVPNDRLGPDEEPQHARKWTALSFKRFLEQYFDHVRVEVLGPPASLPRDRFPSDRGQPSFLLGVCGFPKAAKLSVCFPARDEAADIEKTLASFRGVADELVVGIDPRTTDNTRELAEKYADFVFDLTELHGPPGEEVPEGGVHFAHIRNQCMARCTQPWIFMTEAHEPLWQGADVLLHLDQLPDYVQVVQVVRTGGKAPNRQQWLFPWLCKNRPDIRYVRSTHNTLEYGDLPYLILPQVKTLHERVHAKDVARQKQRKLQNRVKLMEDWLEHGNEWSLHYLGAEWREWDTEKAIRYLREYLAIGKSGALRFHTRLVLAKELTRAGRSNEAVEVLHGATADDWSRSEHWVFLGDLAFEREAFEEAITYYQYAAARNEPPLTSWWVDLSFYGWIPQQRLAMAYSAVGKLDEALVHARRLLDEYDRCEAPEAFVTEANDNISLLETAIHERDRHDHAAQ